MTRINVGVNPKELCREHLLAECRELKRIPNNVKKGKYKMDVPLPSSFNLGKGHERFFIDKLLYLQRRYKSLREEALNRNYNVTDFSDAFDNLPKHLLNDYTPTERDRSIVLERIEERLKVMNQRKKK